jgi:hypothetical protein
MLGFDLSSTVVDTVAKSLLKRFQSRLKSARRIRTVQEFNPKQLSGKAPSI